MRTMIRPLADRDQPQARPLNAWRCDWRPGLQCTWREILTVVGCVKADASAIEQNVLTFRPLSHPCAQGQVNLIEVADLSHLVGSALAQADRALGSVAAPQPSWPAMGLGKPETRFGDVDRETASTSVVKRYSRRVTRSDVDLIRGRRSAREFRLDSQRHGRRWQRDKAG